MPLIDGMYFNGCETDPGFVGLAEEIYNCGLLEACGICEKCCHYKQCSRMFSGLCETSVHHRLSDDEVAYYRRKYQEITGIAI